MIEREKDENLESQENTESEIEGEKKGKKLIKYMDQQTYGFVDEQQEGWKEMILNRIVSRERGRGNENEIE